MVLIHKVQHDVQQKDLLKTLVNTAVELFTVNMAVIYYPNPSKVYIKTKRNIQFILWLYVK